MVVVSFGSMHINEFSRRLKKVRRGQKTECWDQGHGKSWKGRKFLKNRKEQPEQWKP